MILVADDQMRLADASDIACDWLGYDRPELLTLSVPDIVATGRWPSVSTPSTSATESGADSSRSKRRTGERWKRSTTPSHRALISASRCCSPSNVAGPSFALVLEDGGRPTPPAFITPISACREGDEFRAGERRIRFRIVGISPLTDAADPAAGVFDAFWIVEPVSEPAGG
jgi:hypothetical protein